jgi:iron complex outermembrane receptor protein
MSYPKPRFAHHAVALAALAAIHLGAQAQSTAPVEPGKLDVITISAERKKENVQEVPVSASVLQGELLDVINTGGQDVRGLSGRVPSLNIESSFGRAFPRFYIRGYGNTDFRLNASQPVSLVYDDIVQENPILKGFPAFDLAGIEVLRGPQGSLFGRNTPAGVVKFDSVRPSTKSEGYGSLSFGTYSTVNAEGAINVPLGADSAMRFSVLNQTRSDWVHNTYAAGPTQNLEGYRDSAFRAQYLIEPSKDFSALIGVHARDFDGSARLFRANIIKPGTNDLVDGFDPAKISIDGQNKSVLTNYGANARLKMGLGGGLSLFSITGVETVRTYSRGDIDGGYGASFLPSSGPGNIPFSSETADGMPDHLQLTQEFRIESAGAGPLSWQAGLYLFHEDYKIESFSYDSTSGGAQNGYERVHQKNDAYAVFGGVNYAITPAFKLRGGLRYTHDKKDFNVEAYNSTGFGTPPDLATLAAAGPLSASPSDSKVSWDLSGTYALDKNTNLYARAATGFRGSSVQGAGFFNNQSEATPENNTSYEVGVKADLFDRRARVNFDVFQYTVKDLQLTAVGGAQNSNILLNAKKATGQGFELDMQAFISDNLLASLGVGYNDTKIKDPGLAVGICAACTVTNPTKVVVNPVTGTSSTVALIDGNPLPQAPKITTSFSLKYTQPMGAGEAYVFTDWVYRSKVNFFLYESTEFTSKSLTEGGLRLGYTWGNGKYDAAAFVRNLTNQIRVVGGIDFNNLTGFINDPRTYGVQFKASF